MDKTFGFVGGALFFLGWAATAHRLQRDTDLALFRLLQQTRPGKPICWRCHVSSPRQSAARLHKSSAWAQWASSCTSRCAGALAQNQCAWNQLQIVKSLNGDAGGNAPHPSKGSASRATLSW